MGDEALTEPSHPAVGVVASLASRLAGIGALAVGLALLGALVSYDVDDPSFLTATGRPPANWLGSPGAMLADPLMRGLGLGAWALALVVIVWGWRLAALRGDERFWSRLLAMPVAVGAAAIFASLHMPWESWQLPAGLGGFLGDRGAEVLLRTLPAPPLEALPQATMIAGLALMITGGLALGITALELRLFLAWLLRLSRRVLGPAALAAADAVARQAERQRLPRSERLDPPTPVGRARRALPAEELIDDDEQPTASRGAALKDALIGTLSAGGRRAGGLLATASAAARDGMQGLGEAAGTTASPGVPREPGLRSMGGAPEPTIGAPMPAAETAAHDPAALSTAMRALRETQESDNRFEDEASVPLPTDTATPAPETPIAAAKKAAPKLSKRAAAEVQPSLFDAGLGNDTYEAPALSLLAKPVNVVRPTASQSALAENARMLETVLDDYGVRGEIVAVKPGPVVTLYELEPAPGLKASRVIGLADDIARSMSALSARIATVPGRSVIGIELPNPERETVFLREALESRSYGDSRFPLALALGKDIEGEPVIANLAKMPHLLIAGTTGSGKSVAVNTMILSLLYRLSPKQCRLIMIDPKMLELSVYDNIPHLLAPVVTDPKKAVVALKWVVAEMEERYRRMSKLGVRNIDGYNARCRDAVAKGEAFTRTIQTGFDEATGEPVYETQEFAPEEMPLIVVIVDEMADLMMVAGKEIEACIQRLAQMARASGIHLIMATQRPSVDVITGTIKANFPTRISFQVTSKIDSRTILGEQGAEQLLGQGDMLYMSGGGRIRRVHGPFVSDEEVEEVVRHLKSLGQPAYVDAVTEGGDEETQSLVDEKLGLAAAGDGDDALYDKAVAIVARDRKCSTSYIQRKLAIGYNKAARLVEMMEDQGVVSPANAVGKREILVAER